MQSGQAAQAGSRRQPFFRRGADWSIRTKLLLGFGLVIALFGCTALLMYRGIRHSQEREAALRQSNAIINQTDSLLLALVDMETGERGFLLSGNEAFLEPYSAGLARVRLLEAELLAAVGADPAQAGQVLAIHTAIGDWEANAVAPLLALRRAVNAGEEDMGAVLAFVGSGIGKEHFDAIRRSIASFRAVEEVHLLRRAEESRQAARLLTLAVIGGPLAAMLAALGIAQLLEKSIIERVQRLAGAAQQIAADHTALLPDLPRGNDEIGQLTASFLAMAHTLTTQISAAERLSASIRESEERFRQLAEHIQEVFWLMDPADYQILYVSPAYEAIWGRSAAGLLANEYGLFDTIHPDDHAVVRAARPAMTSGGHSVEYRIVRPDGSIRWIYSRAFPIEDASGHVFRIAGIAEDCTLRRETDTLLRQAHEALNGRVAMMEIHERDMDQLNTMSTLIQACITVDEAHRALGESLQGLFPQTSGLVAIFKASQNILEAVAHWGDLPMPTVLGRDECWALRRGQAHWSLDPASVHFCHHIAAGPAAPALCVPMVARGELLGVLHLRMQSLENRRHLEFLVQAVVGQLGLTLANLNLQQTLQHQSIRDSLTGLFNRRYFEETLEREMLRAQRGPGQMGVMMLDVDHFKRFNDTFGHAAGDVLLQSVGGLLKSSIRGSDIACRYGGEEFIIVVPDASVDSITEQAERIRVGIKSLQVQYQRQQLPPITASIGIALFPLHASTAEALVANADAALYQAKHNGRDRIEFAPSLLNRE